ncbi:MAG TPA: PQQ-binding-like beta-propeller repeat protein, partial [Ktedonobacterales bacterium]|nr:PQQ-binding-like beta-propeller repeat protein [Ktedonobacterales bacterium]
YVFAASDGMLLVTATRHLAMLDATSGAVLWQKDLSFDIMTYSFTSNPFAQGIVCVVPSNVWQGSGATRELLGIRAADGTVLWHAPPDSTSSGAILTGGTLYLDAHSAYDAATGKLLWRSTAFRRVLFAVGWLAA